MSASAAQLVFGTGSCRRASALVFVVVLVSLMLCSCQLPRVPESRQDGEFPSLGTALASDSNARVYVGRGGYAFSSDGGMSLIGVLDNGSVVGWVGPNSGIGWERPAVSTQLTLTDRGGKELFTSVVDLVAAETAYFEIDVGTWSFEPTLTRLSNQDGAEFVQGLKPPRIGPRTSTASLRLDAKVRMGLIRRGALANFVGGGPRDATPESREEYLREHQDLSPVVAELIRSGDLAIGMTDEQVVASRGYGEGLYDDAIRKGWLYVLMSGPVILTYRDGRAEKVRAVLYDSDSGLFKWK